MSQFDIDFDNHLAMLQEEPWVLEEQEAEERKRARRQTRRRARAEGRGGRRKVKEDGKKPQLGGSGEGRERARRGL